MTGEKDAPAEMPVVEERLRRILAEARIEPEPEASDFAVENIKALFAPILAERERLAVLVEDVCATPPADFAGMELEAFHRGADAMNEAIAAAIRGES